MTPNDEDRAGTISVSPKAIAAVASQALLTCYGVVGMAARGPLTELAATVTRDPHRGITVRVDRNKIYIDAYIIIQHGTRVSEVASSVINAIRFNVEKAISTSVEQVNVYVQGLRVMEDSRQES